MLKIEAKLQESGYQGENAAFFVYTLQALNLTTPKNIADAIVTIKDKDTDKLFFQGEEIGDLLRDLRAKGENPESNSSYSLEELNTMLKSLSKKDIQAIFAFLGQITSRSRGERWEVQEGERAEALQEQIKTNQERLLSNVETMGFFDEKLPDTGTKLVFSIVDGATMTVVKSRLDFMLKHKEFLKTTEAGGLGIFMAAGDRKLKPPGKPISPSDDKVLSTEGGFIKEVCDRFGSDATEAHAVQYLLETHYGLKDGMIDGIPCEVVQGTKELSENQDRTDTYGATRQVIKNIIAMNPDFFKEKRNIALVTNNFHIGRQGLTFKRAFEAEFSGKLPEGLQIIPIGAGRECKQVSLSLLSDIVGETSWEKLLNACPELKQVQDAILIQKRDLGVAESKKEEILPDLAQTSNAYKKRTTYREGENSSLPKVSPKSKRPKP